MYHDMNVPGTPTGGVNKTIQEKLESEPLSFVKGAGLHVIHRVPSIKYSNRFPLAYAVLPEFDRRAGRLGVKHGIRPGGAAPVIKIERPFEQSVKRPRHL